jgi:hypothetical protein
MLLPSKITIKKESKNVQNKRESKTKICVPVPYTLLTPFSHIAVRSQSFNCE